MGEKILVGLDIGTNSVGWCVTDEDNHIIKKNGKHLWGVRMFDEASKANERRSFRSNRRRLNRRKERINLLRLLFAEEINKVDPSFYYRLDNSFFKNEDRTHPFNYTLFNDIAFTDSNYYKKYPTIYHLRKHLLESDKREDIRLIYLAIHHMIKYRGNFLYSSDEFQIQNQNQLDELFISLKEMLEKIVYIDEEPLCLDYTTPILNKLLEINETYSGISLLKEKFNELLNHSNDKFLKEVVIPLMVGAEVSLKKTQLTNIENTDKTKICAKMEDFDIFLSELLSDNPNQEELITIFSLCKNIYDTFLLKKLLGSHKNIKFLSDAMCERYQTHKDELKELKDYVKTKFKSKYNTIFRLLKKDGKTIPNYANYIGSTIINGVKETTSHISQDDFYKFLKNELNLTSFKITESNKDTFEAKIIAKMDDRTYLLRQNSGSNGIFPYQLNLAELKIILEKQSTFYPFLIEKDKSGLSNIDKIISILKYKIPYYVGPLMSPKANNNRSKFSWIQRTEEKIYPWNFDKVVNTEKTAKNFIYRMLNKCTYLPSCYCLPKNSLIFSLYDVLSVLNKIKVNGKVLSYEDKDELIENVFKTRRKVTKKDLTNYLKNKYGDSNLTLTTSNNKELREITCNLSSYYDFTSIYGSDYVNSNRDLIEAIIRDIVIFEDKNILEKRLRQTYKIKDSNIIKKIKGLSYTKYASISKELLLDIKTNVIDEDTGELIDSKNIFTLMMETNKNIQEIIYDPNYQFKENIQKYNKEHLQLDKNLSIEEYVTNLGFVSPGMKRPLIQAYKICEEIEKILNHRIDEYYVECSRTNKEKKGKAGEKSSRHQQLLTIYSEAIKVATGEIKNHLKTLRTTLSKLDADKFRSDKYFLYFTQMGKCMYSGDDINIDDIFNTNLYDIDHIYPQSLLKDDSINNRVLVKQDINRNQKKDIYPIPQHILFHNNYKAAYAFYKMLKECGFISEEKYRRLTAVELTENELESFLNRQLVFTNQAVKGFINAIETLKSDENFHPKIVYSKGENVSSFRQNFDLPKSRLANNFHHAHDAYLNIIIGRTIDTYFSSYKNRYAIEYLKTMHDNGYTTNVDRIFFQNKNKSKTPIVKNNHIVWDYDKSLKEVEKNLFTNFNILTSERVINENKLFDKIQILPIGGGNVPVKETGPLSDVKKYGGFIQYSFGSYALLKVNGDYILEGIPTLYRNRINHYLTYHLNYSNYEILIENIKKNTLCLSGKKRFAITGKSGNNFLLKNKSERIFSKNEISVIKRIDKLNGRLSRLVTGKETLEEINNLGFAYDGKTLVISPASNKNNKEITISENELTKFYNNFIQLLNKELFSYSVSKKISSKLVEKKDVFAKLSILGKNRVVYNLLGFLSCNERNTIDLSLLNLGKNVGTLVLSKKLSNIKIIHQSITGYYEKVVIEIK